MSCERADPALALALSLASQTRGLQCSGLVSHLCRPFLHCRHIWRTLIVINPPKLHGPSKVPSMLPDPVFWTRTTAGFPLTTCLRAYLLLRLKISTRDSGARTCRGANGQLKELTHIENRSEADSKQEELRLMVGSVLWRRFLWLIC